MKKTLFVTSLVIFAIVLSGCTKKTTEAPTPVQEQTQQEALSEASQIVSAMQSGQPLRCTILDKTTQDTMEYSMEGKKFRVDGIESTNETTIEQAHIISTGEYFYSWSMPSNQGIKMAIPDEETLKEQTAQFGNVPDLSTEKAIEEYEDTYTINCAPAIFDATTFTPPADVAFQDMSAMMENALQQAQQGMTDEQKMQMEEMMQQYGDR